MNCNKNCTRNTSEDSEVSVNSFESQHSGKTFGAGIAIDAISQMSKSDDSGCDHIYLDAKDFLHECDVNGKDPVDVIYHIIHREGIYLDDEPKDVNKRLIFKILLLALKIFVNATVDMLESSGNCESLVANFLRYISKKFGSRVVAGIVSDRKESGGESSRSSVMDDGEYVTKIVLGYKMNI